MLSPDKANEGASSWSGWSSFESKVITFAINADNKFMAPTEYRSPTAFQAFLRSGNKPSRSIHILEGLAPSFISTICDHFRIHPSVFADHHRLVAFSERVTGESGGIPFLPSSIEGRRHVSLKYHEALTVYPRPTGFRNLCQTTGRHLMATRISETLSEVMIARRKCTVWSRKLGYDGWDCLVICDPPIRRILTGPTTKHGFNVATSQYNGGYLDFTPCDSQLHAPSGPPFTSLLDDISFYIRNHSARLDVNDPLCALLFIEKIIASHFMKTIEFVESTLEKLQWTLSRRTNLSEFTLTSAERHFSDIQAWERRVNEFKNDLLGIMLQLRIAPGQLDLDRAGTLKPSATDFRFLHHRLTELSQVVSRVNGSIASLVSFTGSRSALKAQELSLQMADQSIRDANNIKALTILGLVFIPFSYTASLFSMADGYSPSGGSFWIYFAVSLPLTGLLVLGYFFLTKNLHWK
ncbi:hypothetical protein K461DRAFT_298658 [Myriangium duriaei CBS 260.36]|uniref:Uncharacterized protein n=1 Tax=Myriangium duriaei CBS 260.36 TaxID=1168546 RepID=A0A9P4MKS2_9PEZI|nr:hypothetical protein K461DRAFT_298658 [Myriangium duriaei CBS 260.36]